MTWRDKPDILYDDRDEYISNDNVDREQDRPNSFVRRPARARR